MPLDSSVTIRRRGTSSPFNHSPNRIGEAVQRLRSLRFVQLLEGEGTGGAIQPTDFAAPREQAMRHSPFMTLYFRHDRHARFWFREARFYALFLAVMRASRWLVGAEAPVTVRSLAASSGLSVPTVCGMLRRAEMTGDLVRHTYAADQRRQVFEPSASCAATLRALVTEFTAMAAAYTGRPDPLAGLPAGPPADVCRFFVEQALDNLAALDRMQHTVDRKAFAFLVWDALAEGPVLMRDFVPREARRLGVTQQTIRNVLARAERGGWIAPGETLVASERARRVFGAVLTTMEARWSVMLDVMAQLAARTGPVSLPRPTTARG
jgi:DNA-binding MarR family transcriptional regulator